jgi:amino acid transporter
MAQKEAAVDKKRWPFGAWVPQLFFDIIGRFVPGLIAIALILIAAYGPESVWEIIKEWLNKPKKDYPSLLPFLGLGAVLSYGLAIVFWGFWYRLCYVKRKFFKEGGVKEFEPETGISMPEEDFWYKYDYIKFKDASAGSRITKLKAELHLCGVLILSAICCVILVISKALWSWSIGYYEWFFIIILFAIIYGIDGARRHFVRRLRFEVENCASLHGCKAKPPEEDNSCKALN